MSRVDVPETTGTHLCPLIIRDCRHFSRAYRFIRKEYSVWKTHETESAVFREEWGSFCNAEGMFTALMSYGCPNVTGYDYLAARTGNRIPNRGPQRDRVSPHEGIKVKVKRSRDSRKDSIPRACNGSSKKYPPVRASRQATLTKVC